MRREYDWNLPPRIKARLGNFSYGRQRCIFEDGTLLLILHDPPNARDISRVERVFLRKPDGAWMCNGREDGARFLKALLADYTNRLTKLDRDTRAAYQSLQYLVLIRELTPLLRSARDLFDALQQARETIPADQLLIDSRDAAYELHRGFELLHQDAKSAMDFEIAKHTEADAVVTRDVVAAQHRLNILAAVFFPFTALAALFGMNFQIGVQSLGGPAGFWLVLIAGLFLGSALRGWVSSARSSAPRPPPLPQ